MTWDVIRDYILARTTLSEQEKKQADINKDLLINVGDIISLFNLTPTPTPTATPENGFWRRY
jgi:hypothetical protein